LRLIVSGGGTGGHIYPALAIAQAARAAGDEVCYVGAAGGMESRIVPRSGIDFCGIDIAGLNQRSKVRKIRALLGLPRALGQAKAIIRRFRPEVIIGTGGYASFPVVWAGSFRACRTYIHESNAFPGWANRCLARRVEAVFLTFPEAGPRLKARRLVTTGLPVRADLSALSREAARQQLGLAPERFTLLIFGGSQGAASLNRAAGELAAAVFPAGAENQAEQWIWITGPAHYEALAERWREQTAAGQIQLYPYLHEMGLALSAADLAVCRAGASSLSELCALGLPAILVPYPHAADDHQTYNARALQAKGAALMLADTDLSGATLGPLVASLRADLERRAAMRQNALAFNSGDALAAIMKLIHE
jgi:UDP-N-acetylglucosamine--N-acetylmuramyl-(pentapeptide) pyrophosphoryl-undecaprenol N-acetylglucosamine transferase